MRDFNELDHELLFRLNRAYKPSVKYMDLFTHPLVSLFARNIAFVAGSIFAVLIVLTVIQEDLLTASNVLKILTSLGMDCGNNCSVRYSSSRAQNNDTFSLDVHSIFPLIGHLVYCVSIVFSLPIVVNNVSFPIIIIS